MRFTFGCMLMLVALASFSQPSGIVDDRLIHKSKILNKDVRYAVYLPPDYERSARTYPVVYLLHGFSDDQTGWVTFGEINRYADKAIHDGTIPPMIIIMPNGDSSFYINSYDGAARYEDFFISEFMPAMERTYKIKGEKRYRGVAGLSMGGYGTLIYALKHPDLFAACAPLSAAVWTEEEIINMPEGNYEFIAGKLFGRGLKGRERLTENWQKYSILKIISDKTVSELRKVRYWIDCGDDDFLVKGNCLLKIALTDKGVPHEFRMRDGAHNWTYWRTGIVDALAFIGNSFRQF